MKRKRSAGSSSGDSQKEQGGSSNEAPPPRQVKQIKRDVKAIGEKTINILMGRTKQEAKRKEMLDDSPDKATIAKLGVDESSLSSATCYICSGLRDCLSCSFCGKESCLNCARRCDACGEIFCGFCSLLNYDEREVRSFCLGCTPRLES